MKYFITLLVILFSFSSASAAAPFTTLSCTSDPDDDDRPRDSNGAFLIDRLAGDCVNEDNGNRYTVFMGGFGPAIKDGLYTSFRVACDNYNGEEILGHYTGGKVSAALFLGLTVAVYRSSDTGLFCYVDGVGFELGAGISVGQMSIKPIRE